MNFKSHCAGASRGLRRLAAFTMIEIALALAVIGFALVAIIGVLPAGMNVQKDNRESTLVNFDANFLMDAITSGSQGTDDLTNHIIAITNYYTLYDNGAVVEAHSFAYTPTGTSKDGTVVGATVLTNGANIIALLTTPKYVLASTTPTVRFYSNYITADFRGITGSLADQGISQAARDFAFTYRVYPEVIPYAAASTTAAWTNNPDSGVIANNFQNNFTQVRLRFRWPLLPNGQVGNSRLTFRTSASGNLFLAAPLFPFSPPSPIPTAFIQSGTYLGQ